MKRFCIKQKERQMRLISRSLRRRCKKKRQSAHNGQINCLHIKAPEVFSLADQGQRKLLLQFIERLRRTIVYKDKLLCIDFTETKKMFADGALLFVAELQRSMRVARSKHQVKIRCKPPRNQKAAQVLKQVGILSLLKYRRRIVPTDKDVVNWRFANGHEVVGERYDDILGHYDGMLTSCIQTGFYHGLTEAMTNCCHHAYILKREDGLAVENEESNWWMFSQEKDGELSVVFCDLGVGIPRTLPLKSPPLWKKIMSTIGMTSDGKIIQAAVEESKTRTGLHHRGKGMKQLLEVAQKSKNGHLVVYSNRGCYSFRNGKEYNYDFKDSVLGTLITWKVAIEQNPETC